MTWPSTVTSPVFPISVSSIVFSRSRRINTLVRRSTKRSVRRSCNASDSLSSTARATPCQCSGSASQSGRLATKVQVLTCAIRLERVSMSPSVRSAWATWRGEPVGRDVTLSHQKSIEGHRPVRHGWPARSCGSREPGRHPTTARRRPGFAPARRTSSSRAACSSTRMSSAVGARVRPGLGRRHRRATPARRRSRRNRDRNCAIAACAPARSVWLSSACTSSGSNGSQRPVVPKVPSRVRAAGAAGDLRELGRVELAELVAVELAVGRRRRRDRRRD